jgi:hypothetical protein
MDKSNSSNWSYLAGLFDGEGTVSIGASKNSNGTVVFQLHTKIANTDLRLMQWLIKTFGGTYSVSSSKKHKKNYRLQYTWHPTGKANRKEFLENIIPYLVIKKEQALIGLEFDSIYDRNGSQPGFKLTTDTAIYQENHKKREEFRIKLQNLNHKIKI